MLVPELGDLEPLLDLFTPSCMIASFKKGEAELTGRLLSETPTLFRLECANATCLKQRLR